MQIRGCNMFAGLLLIFIVNGAKHHVYGQMAEDCTSQREKMFECLNMLTETSEEQEMAMAKKALTEESGMQALFLSQWERTIASFEKCRKLDANFDKCMPTTITPPDLKNHSNYLLDKVDCARSSSNSLYVMDLKEKFIDEVEMDCFNKTLQKANDEPCRPNEAVEKCLADETLQITQDWLISQDKASIKLGKLFEQSKKEKLNRWRCYECVYLTSEECRPTEQQSECIEAKKRPIFDAFEKSKISCMQAKGYSKLPEAMPEIEQFTRGRQPPKTDFCGWIRDEISFY